MALPHMIFKPNKTLTRSPPSNTQSPAISANNQSKNRASIFDPIGPNIICDLSSDSESEYPVRQRSFSFGDNESQTVSRDSRRDFLKAPEVKKPGKGTKGKRKLSGGNREDKNPKKISATVTSETDTSGLQAVPTIPVSNRYNAISDDEIEIENENRTAGTVPNASEVAPTRDDSSQSTRKIQTKPPPIVLKNVKDFMTLARNIKRICSQDVAFQSRTDSTRLQTATPDDYRSATSYLRQANVEFHTYTLQEERKSRLVIRGLDPSIKLEEVIAELAASKVECSHVSQLRSTLGEKKPLPLFIVSVDKDNETTLKKLTRLCYCIIRIEIYRSPKGPPQCHRCQKFGHTARFCTTAPKCVKCGNGHDTNTCLKAKTEPAKCSNCNGDHTANYRGCPYYKTVKDRMQGSGNQRPIQTPRFIPAPAPTVNAWQKPTGPSISQNSQLPRVVNVPNSFSSHFPAIQRQSQYQYPHYQSLQATPSSSSMGATNIIQPRTITMPREASPNNQSYPTTIPPPLPHQQAVRNLDLDGIFKWAQTLMVALANTRPEESLNVIIAHVMPLMLVQSLVTPRNGQP